MPSSRLINKLKNGVPGEFGICRHFHPRVQDELSQSFDFLIFKRGNHITPGYSKANVLVVASAVDWWQLDRNSCA